jgi:hypothetical protein
MDKEPAQQKPGSSQNSTAPQDENPVPQEENPGILRKKRRRNSAPGKSSKNEKPRPNDDQSESGE